MLIFAKFFICLLSLLLPGCHDAEPEVAGVQKPTVKSPSNIVSAVHQPTSPRITNDVAVFNIQGQAKLSPNSNFNRWATLPKTKGRVHLFANEEETLNPLSGVKHVVLLNQLASKLGETLSTVDPQRLIIFLTGHGGTTGNFCYESQNSCHLTANILVDAFRGYAKRKDRLLRHVLVVPSFCYNKLLMDQFAELVRSEHFPFIITFISQKSDGICGAQSPAESLYENQILPFQKLSDKRVDEFLRLATVEQLVNFQNELIISDNPGVTSELEFQVRHAPHPSPTKLSDFGFDMRLLQELYDCPVDATGKHIDPKAFPNRLTVKALLDELKLPAHVQPKTQILSFHLVEREPNGNQIVRNINVSGNLSLVINELDLQAKPIATIQAILSQR